MKEETKAKLCFTMIPIMCMIGIVSGLWISNSVSGLAFGMFLSAVLSFPFMLRYSKENPGMNFEKKAKIIVICCGVALVLGFAFIVWVYFNMFA